MAGTAGCVAPHEKNFSWLHLKVEPGKDTGSFTAASFPAEEL